MEIVKPKILLKFLNCLCKYMYLLLYYLKTCYFFHKMHVVLMNVHSMNILRLEVRKQFALSLFSWHFHFVESNSMEIYYITFTTLLGHV